MISMNEKEFNMLSAGNIARLRTILVVNQITIWDLQYISADSFKRLRQVGKHTFTCAEVIMKSLGLRWGILEVDEYKKRRPNVTIRLDDVLPELSAIVPNVRVTGNSFKVDPNRRDAALKIYCAMIMAKCDLPPHELARRAVEEADELIEQLTK